MLKEPSIAKLDYVEVSKNVLVMLCMEQFVKKNIKIEALLREMVGNIKWDITMVGLIERIVYWNECNQ